MFAVLADRGRSLRESWHFDWPRAIEQAVFRLRLDAVGPRLLPVVAIVGGASSGKSTVFNNLLGGRLTSRITARGHATVGPILAIHEDDRTAVEPLLSNDMLLPKLQRRAIELEADTTGSPNTLAVVHHQVDALRGVLLLDTPDFSSEAARIEGDVALTLLPWFDRIVVVLDHERWFDRQSVSMLRGESSRFGVDRFAVFNRTKEGALAESDREALERQADRIGATGLAILEFRRGRGFCRFPPDALKGLHGFLCGPAPDRTKELAGQVARAANDVLNQNEERAARLAELQRSVSAAVEQTVPGVSSCLTSLMTASERKHLDVVSRVLRLDETRHWLTEQRARLGSLIRQVPLLRSMVSAGHHVEVPADRGASDSTDRAVIAVSICQRIGERAAHELQRTIQRSSFWEEMRRWTSLEPEKRAFAWTPELRTEIDIAARAVDIAITQWTTKVEAECRGISPRALGALGGGALGLAVVLIAVPGPLAALTLVSAKTAVAAAVVKLAAASGTGALLGKQVVRLSAVIQEKLIGSAEFRAVGQSVETFRAVVRRAAQRLADEVVAEAAALVLDESNALLEALEAFRNGPEKA